MFVCVVVNASDCSSYDSSVSVLDITVCESFLSNINCVVQVGDYVKLEDGTEGQVKFVGAVTFADEEMVGL